MAEAFAVCEGRFAAMDDAWSGPGLPGDTARMTADFADLSDAVAPVEPALARDLRVMTIRARAQQARLLRIARHAADPRRAAMAGRMLAQRLRACAALLP
jgi:hypothetical protein